MFDKELFPLDTSGVDTATSISVCVCTDPTCAVHLVLWVRDRIVAHAPLTCELAKGVIADMNEIIEAKTAIKS